MLLIHLLKWQFQKDKRKGGWENSMDGARQAMNDLIAESPSLKTLPGLLLDEAYSRARRKAARETLLPISAFPLTCPYDVKDLLDEDFLPGA